MWIVIGVAAAIFVLVFVVAATFNVFSAETVDEAEERWTGLPEGFTGADFEAVTFRPALRGYRMEDVDQAMQILRQRLDELEAAVSADDDDRVRSAAATSNDGAGAAADVDLAEPANDRARAAREVLAADAEETAAGPR